ncbi:MULTISPECIES: outer membrane protein [unclassified Bartonella]|uniref:outer membrane protein n=1 Tax=unclassified Bartonella TaxID=2645622 RepID=UPI00099B1F6D|nr:MULTISPECIES: outer membrane protein [unclassified Bartonella]AQX28220.1 outer membrane immunogenic protein [Bartonella sp. JB15]AQX29491.1 outer membrane immunogenic protein [Bartonella sp. JB63]
MKRLTTSIFALLSVSVAQAADFVIPYQSSTVPPVISLPPFSWTGFYFGGHVGGFEGPNASYYLSPRGEKKEFLFKNNSSLKLSGVIGGLYAGSNVDINNGLVVGFDTDINWSSAKDTKSIDVNNFLTLLKKRIDTNNIVSPIEEFLGLKQTVEQKWVGATRIRVGFGFDRVMPYFAGGVAYTHLKNSYILEAAAQLLKNKVLPQSESDFSSISEEKTMIGFTVGGGLDLAMTDNLILRAEYRYSDFNKKKFTEKFEIKYKSNDFRVGVAYKF